MFDEGEFRPDWDGTMSANQVEQITKWPNIPFEILLHDPAVYAAAEVWSAEVEDQWGTDEAAFASLAPKGAVHVVEGSGHNIYQDALDESVDAVRRVLQAVQRDD